VSTLLAMTLPARLDAAAQGVAFVVACATAAGLPPGRVAKIELAVEEALVNICRYAYGEGAGEIHIRCRCDESGQFLIELVDTGRPFNILAQPEPDLTADLEQRPVGGLGVLLIRSLVDQVTYRREADRNILQLAVQQSR